MPEHAVPTIVEHVPRGQVCCDPRWEAAYKRFETPDEEIAKFTDRLTKFGFPALDKGCRIVDLFCGRGNGLVALERMGFTNLEGVDLSDTLLEQYTGSAKLHLADCTDMPLDANAYDVVIVQGGLHHLPKLPADLDSCLASVNRILKPDGTFYVVEPWLTTFLKVVHAIVQQPIMRKVYAKGDALAEMIDHERETYEQWLGQPREILQAFEKHFVTKSLETKWGKLNYSGSPKAT